MENALYCLIIRDRAIAAQFYPKTQRIVFTGVEPQTKFTQTLKGDFNVQNGWIGAKNPLPSLIRREVEDYLDKTYPEGK